MNDLSSWEKLWPGWGSNPRFCSPSPSQKATTGANTQMGKFGNWHSTATYPIQLLRSFIHHCYTANVHYVTLNYHPTAPRRVQITPKTSANITRHFYSRGPARQVLATRKRRIGFKLRKMFLLVKTNFFPTFFLDKNLIVKKLSWSVIWTVERRFFSRCKRWNKLGQWLRDGNHKNESVRASSHYAKFFLFCKKICQRETILSANDFFRPRKLCQASPNLKETVE